MNLEEARAAIDTLDQRLVQLINDRAKLAQEIGGLKGGSHYRPEREADVLRRARERNAGPLDDDTVARILRELMSACLRLESPMSVAYLGPEGTYSEDAVLRFFGAGVDASPVADIPGVFAAVEAGRAQHGVVPVENSTAGLVSQTLMQFIGSKARIVGEVTLPIHHVLAGRDPSVIRGHAQALAQCHAWLDANHPNVPRVAVSSNAEAARLARDDGGLAIASERAAELYGLDVVARGICDPRNRTRFLVIGTQNVPPTGHDRTTIVMAARNKPGALVDLLRPFADAGLNIARVQSLPARDQPWEDHFFVDVEGHQSTMQAVLDAVEQEAAFFAWLGSYPSSVV